MLYASHGVNACVTCMVQQQSWSSCCRQACRQAKERWALCQLVPVLHAGVVQSAADGAASPSISDDEQYQKLDSTSLWQQGQGNAGGDGVPAGTLPATDAEPEVQQAGMDDREVGNMSRVPLLRPVKRDGAMF